MVKRITEDTKETLGQFFLCKEFNTISLTLPILCDGFIANAAKLCPFVGKAHPIKQTDRIIGISLVKPSSVKRNELLGMCSMPAT